MSEKLHSFLVDTGNYSKTYQDFSAQFATPETQAKLYDYMISNNTYTKSQDEFNAQFFSAPKTAESLTKTKEDSGEWKLDMNTMSWMSPEGVVTPRSEVPSKIRKIHQEKMKMDNVDDDNFLVKGLKFVGVSGRGGNIESNPDAVNPDVNSVYYSIDYFKPSVTEEQEYKEKNKKAFDDYIANKEKLDELELQKSKVKSVNKVNNTNPSIQIIDPSTGELISDVENQKLDVDAQKAKEISQRILNDRNEIEAQTKSSFKGIKKAVTEAKNTYNNLVKEGKINANDVTEEKIFELARELQNQYSKNKIFEDNIQLFIEDNQGLLEFTTPEYQKRTVKVGQEELLKLGDRKKKNMETLNFSLSQVETIDKKLRAYEKDFKTRHDVLLAEGEVFNKEFNKNNLDKVDENSSQKQIDQYEDWRVRKNTWIEKYNTFKDNEQAKLDIYNELREDRKMHVSNYQSANEMRFQINEDGEDLRLYTDAFKRNGHNVTAGLAWLTTSTINIAMGLEGLAYNLYELPEDIMFEFYDNDPTKMPDIIRNDYVTDKMMDAWRFAGREKVNKFVEDINASVQKPTEYNDIDDLSDLGAFGLHAVSNFLPQLGVMATMGPSSIYVLGASAGGNKFEEYERSNRLAGTNYTLGEKWLATGIAFGAETISEKITFDIFKSLAPVAQKQVKDGVLKEVWYQLQQMSWKGTSKASSRILMESGSEGLAEIMNNFGDITVRGDDISIFENVPGATLTGAFMERSMAMPRLYSKITNVFGGKDYQAKFTELTAEQNEVDEMLSTGDLSQDMRSQLENTWLDLQMQREEILASVHENVDQMTDEEKNRLVEIEVETHNEKAKIDKNNLDKNLTQSQKKTLEKLSRKKQAELLIEKNKMLSKYESEETKVKKKERFDKQVEQVNKRIAKLNQKRKEDEQIEMVVADNEAEVEELLLADQAMLREEIQVLSRLVRESEGKKRKQYQDQLEIMKENLQDSKDAARFSFGFVQENNPLLDGGTRIIINKDAALDVNGNVNVAAHELLHKGLFATIKGDQATQTALGDALLEYAEGLDIKKSAGFNRKLMAYGKFDKKGNFIQDSNFGEEVITTMSESIMDGTLEFEESFFTKIGDIIRQHYRRYVDTEIRFDTGRDVYNFIKDYNASIEKEYESAAIEKVFTEGAKGNLIKTTEQNNKKVVGNFAQNSKRSAFDDDLIIEELGLKEETAKIIKRNKELEDLILKENVKDNSGNVIASIALQQALVRNNLPRAFALARDAAGVANNLTLEDALKQNDIMEWYGEYSLKLAELGRTYKAKMKDGTKVPFGAYMNMLLPLKYSGILEKLKSKVETDRIEDEAVAKKVAKKTTPKIDNGKEELEGTAIALEQMGYGNIMPKLQNIYNKNKNKVKKLSTYKDVKNAIYRAKKEGPFYQALIEVSDIFSEGTYKGKKIKIDTAELAKRIRIKQDLTAPMRKVIQDVILKNSPEMITMVPDGTSVGGDATGIANTILGQWYNKKGKAKFAKTGSRKGLNIQEKQSLDNETFLKPFGLAVKGQRVTNKSVDGALREWVMQVATLAMNQASRQADPKNVSLKKTKEGKNILQFSKRADKILEYRNAKKLVSENKLAPKEQVLLEREKDGELVGQIITMRGMEALQDEENNVTFEQFYANQLLSFFESYPQYYDIMMESLTGGIKRAAFFNKEYFEKIVPRSKKVKQTKQAKVKRLSYNKNKKFVGLGRLDLSIDDGKLEFLIKFFSDIGDYTRKNGNKEIFQELLTHFGIDQNNMFRKSAVLIAIPVNEKGKEVTTEEGVEEHAVQMEMARILLAAAFDGNMKDAIKIIRAVYSQASLRKVEDPSGEYRQSMGDDFYNNVVPRILDGSLDFLPDGYASIYRLMKAGVDPFAYKLVKENQTIAEYFGVNNLSVEDAKQAIIDVFEGKQNIEVLRSQSEVSEIKNINKNTTIQKAISNSKRTKNPVMGITVLDFDDTLATTKSLVKYTAPDGTTGTLNAEEYASSYQDLQDQGFTFDFSEFNKVVKGKIAPLFKKALKLQKKFGPENMFVLTARPPAAAKAIFNFLKANGLNIPLKNITGLANSTAEAKALWIADKVGEGYNDFYFADDALQNVQAVKNMLDQFDVKSKVQQAKIQFSKRISDEFNEMIEQNTGVKKEARFSSAEARARGMGKGKYKLWIPPGAEDFMGLMYTLASAKGKLGNDQLEFIRKSLLEPYNNGIASLNRAKQEISGNYKALLKQNPEIKKLLSKNIEGTSFSYEQAIRVYLWDKAGFEIPGIAEATRKKLIKTVLDNSQMQGFANTLSRITKLEKGYIEPNADWVAEGIVADLNNVTDKIGRKQFLEEFINNVDEAFSEENLNKIEAIYGLDYRDALEDMLYRMKTGASRTSGTTDAQVNKWTIWIRNSVGAIMFVNTRSALLQTISSINFINWSDNNPVKAAAAFANQKQYWKDFVMIFNSPYLKQRRSGLKTDVNEARLAQAIAGKKNKATAALAYLLKMGFLPTQMADSFAIAAGGATFYRNRVKSLMKEGMSQQEAQEQAFQDLQDVANVSQQSSDAALTSRQQNSILGAFVLAFQNTPMQYARLTKKAAIDLIKGRGDWKTNVSRIVYYTAIQNLIFNAMQQALFALSFSDDEDDERELQRQTRLLNGMLDSVLRGTGIYGAVVATAKNIALEFYKQDLKGGRADHAYTILQFANISPPIGSKLRKLYSATQTRKFNKNAMEQMGYDIYNPAVPAIATSVEAFTNLPTGRLYQKFNNVSEAMNEENENWQRIALMMGWNTWDVGVKQSFKITHKGLKKSKSKSKFKSKFKSK